MPEISPNPITNGAAATAKPVATPLAAVLPTTYDAAIVPGTTALLTAHIDAISGTTPLAATATVPPVTAIAASVYIGLLFVSINSVFI
jgi:hypothetical protein